jgi:hypothetical protein
MKKEVLKGRNMNKQNNLMDIEINFESLSEYLKRTYPDRALVFEDRPDDLYELVNDLRRSFKKIGEINKILKRTKKAVEMFEKDFPPSELKGSGLSAEGVVRISMTLLHLPQLSKTTFDTLTPEEQEKYCKYILPETKGSCGS